MDPKSTLIALRLMGLGGHVSNTPKHPQGRAGHIKLGVHHTGLAAMLHPSPNLLAPFTRGTSNA